MFSLTPELLDRTIFEQKSAGKVVRAFLYSNPNNPLGIVYPLSLTIKLMEVCKKHKVHFISDEIYALSVFKKSTPFESILSIPPEKVPDPERTHFLWGLSKDFGLAGFRIGVLHSYSESVIR